MSFDRNSFAALIGIDWADKEHAISMIDTTTGQSQAMTLSHRPDAIEQWAHDLHSRFEGRPLAVALELCKGPLVYALVNYNFLTLFPIPPSTLAKYRQMTYIKTVAIPQEYAPAGYEYLVFRTRCVST